MLNFAVNVSQKLGGSISASAHVQGTLVLVGENFNCSIRIFYLISIISKMLTKNKLSHCHRASQTQTERNSHPSILE